MNSKLLNELGITETEIIDRVVDIVAREIADSIGRDVKSKISEKAEAIVIKCISEAVEDATTREFQPITSWGEKKGPKTTIRDIIEKNVHNWWEVKVDSKGNPSNYSSSQSRAEWYAKEIVSKTVTYELQKEMKAIIEAGKVEIRAAMAQQIQEQIKKIW